MDNQQPVHPREELGAKRGGRPAAGTDPRKRRQILDGAVSVFRRTGFDAASMADVAAEAGVSKATLYVYYPSKEQLFAAVVSEERDRSIKQILEALDPSLPAREALSRFGQMMVQILGRPHVIQAHRIVIGVCERMPDIGQQMYDEGPRRVSRALKTYLETRIVAGELQIEDMELAIFQFLELCQASLIRPRLYGSLDTPVADAEAERVVKGAVDMFLSHYGAR